ncbi:ABC transporter substrate-binding protein [Parafrankia discariae]|uniref:ABC transporter substrate-binding protein n=1 Tax=Parafrankia discariae TaxID=365528 RepID=UPI00036DC514|nr:ABC transporter substrate-binding protein [Parafrankia discariae]
MAAALSVASLVGCAGSDATTDAADGCVAPGVTAREVVKVGLLYPDSGGLASSFGAARAGIDARLGLANASGGVHGRRISYVWRDDQADPSANLTMSRQLVEREGVFGVLETSTASSGGAPYLADAAVPVVGLAVEDAWSRYRNMFSFSYVFTDGRSVDTFGRYVRAQGGTRAVIVRDYAGGSTSMQFADQLIVSLRAAGVEIPAGQVTEYQPGRASATRIAEWMVDNGVDSLVAAMDTETLAQLVDAAREAGVPLKVILTGREVSAELLRAYGARLAGVTSYANYLPFQANSPALDAYRAAVSRYAPQLVDPDQALALSAYVVADMLVRGLEDAGPCPSRRSFMDGLRAVQDYDAGGLITRTDFAEDFGRLRECYAFVRVNAAGTGLEVVDPDFCGSRL